MTTVEAVHTKEIGLRPKGISARSGEPSERSGIARSQFEVATHGEGPEAEDSVRISTEERGCMWHRIAY
jgi:hypothetical protein